MSLARTTVKGVVFCDSYRAYNGVTFLIPEDGKSAWLIDMNGRYVHHWTLDISCAGYGNLLPTGNILYTASMADSPLRGHEGAGGMLVELDWNGAPVWEYKNPTLHDGFCRNRQGNTLAIKWVPVPEAIARKLKEGIAGSESEEVMWGDAILEITPEGEIAWEWLAHEHLDPDTDMTCPLCPCVEWSHANACIELPDGNILTCFRKNDTLAVIEKSTGDVTWRWGRGQLGHPYGPSLLDNGNVLVFDSGYHRQGIDMSSSRVLEVKPYTGEILWSYEEQASQLFYSSTLSSCQRLPNGNTLICEGSTGRIFEVTKQGEPVWEYVNYLPSFKAMPPETQHCKVLSAARFGIDYPGLGGRGGSSSEKQATPGHEWGHETQRPEVREDKVLERLRKLGY